MLAIWPSYISQIESIDTVNTLTPFLEVLPKADRSLFLEDTGTAERYLEELEDVLTMRKEVNHNVPFISDKATLIVNGSIMTTNAAEYITYAKTVPAMITFIQEDKNSWSEDTFQKVDWNATERYMKVVSIGTRAKAFKLQYNWQNTGQQKGLFMTSAGAMPDVVHEASRCPMGCGKYEEPLHYLQCTPPQPNGVAECNI